LRATKNKIFRKDTAKKLNNSSNLKMGRRRRLLPPKVVAGKRLLQFALIRKLILNHFCGLVSCHESDFQGDRQLPAIIYSSYLSSGYQKAFRFQIEMEPNRHGSATIIA
jgi:hypothetical protein